MVAAHSGALAGEHAAWQAFCAATGAVHVSDLAEFTDTLELFSRGPAGPWRRHCDRARFRRRTRAARRSRPRIGRASSPIWRTRRWPPSAACSTTAWPPTNPLDVWGTGADTRSLFGACLRAMADDPAVAVTALAVDLVTEFDGDTAYADAVLDVAEQTDAPLAVLASVPSAIDAATAQRLRAQRDSGAGRCSAAVWRRWVTWPAGRYRSTRRDRGAARQRGTGGGPGSPRGLARVRTCWPTTGCRWWRPDRQLDRRGAGTPPMRSVIRSR